VPVPPLYGLTETEVKERSEAALTAAPRPDRDAPATGGATR